MASTEDDDDLAAALAFLDAYSPLECPQADAEVSPVSPVDTTTAVGPLSFLSRLEAAPRASHASSHDQCADDAVCADATSAFQSSLPSNNGRRAYNRDAGGNRRATATKRQRPPAYNSNHARQQQRKELLALRSQEKELEHTLSILQAAQQRHARPTSRFRDLRIGARAEIGASDGSIDTSPSTLASPKRTEPQGAAREAAVWQDIANRQLEQRAAAESELRRLKRMLETQERLIAELQNLVFCKAMAKAMDAVAGDTGVPHPFVLAVQQFDAIEFVPIMQQVEASYRDIDRVFQRDARQDRGSGAKARQGHMRTDSSGHLYFEIFGSKVFPFDVQTTGDAAWKRFSYSVRPNDANIFSKFFDAPGDTIAELFATELRLNKAKAVIQPKQVKRLYKEPDRVAIVWQSKVNAVEFMGCALSGAEYQENGYFLIERPPLAPEGFAVLRTCYIIAPTVPTHLVPRDSVTFALMKFVFQWMAATIPANHQILEDMLILDSAKCGQASAATA